MRQYIIVMISLAVSLFIPLILAKVRFLKKLTWAYGGVGLVLGCCGAISKWAAREDLAKAARDQFLAAWEQMGRPVLICACPTCRKVLEEFMETEAEIQSNIR